MVCVGAFAYRRILQQDHQQEVLLQIHSALENLDAVQADLLDAETGQRGYIITGDRSYLDPYQAALARVRNDLENLRQMAESGSIEKHSLNRLNSLVAAKLTELKSRIDIRDQQGMDAAVAAVKEGSGKQSMDQIRSVIAELNQDDQESLAKGSRAAAAASKNMKTVMLFGGVLAFVLLSLSGLFVYQEMQRRKRAEDFLRESEERFRLMVSSVKGYAIFMLDPSGNVISWSEGAERITGYKPADILGASFARFYTPEEIEQNIPDMELKVASERERSESEGWRVRKDGSRFWTNTVITGLRDETGRLRGFVKVTRDMTERRKYEQEILRRSSELDAANKELEAFCYSVSHDLRAPLRGIDGFGQALLEDCAGQLDDQGKDYLHRIRAATQRMAVLIDDLLNLSRITRGDVRREKIDLSAIAQALVSELQTREPDRKVEFLIAPGLRTEGDEQLVRLALENLLANAWKFTSKREQARIELGRIQQNGTSAFFVRDNGAGFDPAYSSRLFGAFQRLHTMTEFPGNGIGLATVQRIVNRHGGKIWGESAVDQGATFFFTL